MSPPAADSRPSAARTDSTPSLISHPVAGKRSSFAPRHPAVVLPSQSSAQPSSFSRVLRVFGTSFDGGAVFCASKAWSHPRIASSAQSGAARTASAHATVQEVFHPAIIV